MSTGHRVEEVPFILCLSTFYRKKEDSSKGPQNGESDVCCWLCFMSVLRAVTENRISETEICHFLFHLYNLCFNFLININFYPFFVFVLSLFQRIPVLCLCETEYETEIC